MENNDLPIVRQAAERVIVMAKHRSDPDAAALARLVLAMLKEIDWMEVRSANRVEKALTDCAREIEAAK